MQHESEHFEEVWETAASGARLCALINHTEGSGWLMFQPFDGDAGFRSRNVRYEGAPDAVIEYELSNGQRDFYPRSWALSVEDVQNALAYFRRTGELPPFVVWHDDGQRPQRG